MTKKEMLAKIEALEKRIQDLELRQPIVINYPPVVQPTYIPYTPPVIPMWPTYPPLYPYGGTPLITCQVT